MQTGVQGMAWQFACPWREGHPRAHSAQLLLSPLLCVALSASTGCSGRSVLDEPGVTLPAAGPERTISKEAIALNNAATEVMFVDQAKALALFDEAIELDEDYDLAFANKATLLIDQGKYTAAIACLRRHAKLRPRAEGAYVGWAYCLHRLGQEAASKQRLRYAIAALNVQLEKQPDDPWILTSRAMMAYLYGETERARQELASVLQRSPGFRVAQQLNEEIQPAGAANDPWRLLFNP